ncbi:MAG: phosphotransferase [Acidimicrobiia bacterium]|nr:phosphotransferase [Acidimicrobiia bacterium]
MGYQFADVQNFIKSLYPDATKIAPLSKGGWSDAFEFSLNNNTFVIRFSKYDTDFRKDLYANNFVGSNLPIPKLIKIGNAFDGYFAVSERAYGEMLDQLSIGKMRDTIPSLLNTFDSLRAVDISKTIGFGSYKPNGNAPHKTWADFLLDALNDNPERRVHGWYQIIKNSNFGTQVFDDGLKIFQQLALTLPNSRNLIHYDLLNSNVMVNDNKISAVFDWGCALYGDFVFELATFTFWSPWIDGLKDIDWLKIFKEHFVNIGLDVPDFETRLFAYELYIGLEHMGYNAFIYGWDNFEKCSNVVNDMLISMI